MHWTLIKATEDEYARQTWNLLKLGKLIRGTMTKSLNLTEIRPEIVVGVLLSF